MILFSNQHNYICAYGYSIDQINILLMKQINLSFIQQNLRIYKQIQGKVNIKRILTYKYLMTGLAQNNKSCKIYFLVDDARVYFNADFDSGNVEKVQQISTYTFKVHPGLDKLKYSTNKTFFHFKVYGFKMCIISFVITRVNILQKFIKLNASQPAYRPVYRKSNDQFERIPNQVNIDYSLQGEAQLSFTFQFDNDPFVQFAFSYPYSYEDCEKLIQNLDCYKNHPNIYLHDEILCRSYQGRKVHLLTLTDRQNCLSKSQEVIDTLIMNQNQRPLKISKPVVFLTARVHPGQSASSFCIEGALKFLLNQNDSRSYLLRKNFHFIIIPMINPDGVYAGMFRNDLFGQNLNRTYIDCEQHKNPTIWSIKQLAIWLAKNKNVLFYFDFHAHQTCKNFFIYGNSFNQISLQTEAQLFGKMIEVNCPYFQNLESIYSEKQMKIKHKNDSYSKQGCARVFMQKTFNIVHSYTVQCGIFGPTKLNQTQKIKSNTPYTGNYVEDHEFENIEQIFYTPDSYRLMGKSVLITILDLFGLNPYLKKLVGFNHQQTQVRRLCGNKIYNSVDKFKLIDANCSKKINDLSNIIQNTYYNEKLKGTKFKLASNQSNKLLEEIFQINNKSPKSKRIYLQNLKIIKTNQSPILTLRNTRKQIQNSKKKRHLSKKQSQSQSLSNQDNLKIKQHEKFCFSTNQKGNNIQKSIIAYKTEQMKYIYDQVTRFNQGKISNKNSTQIQFENKSKQSLSKKNKTQSLTKQNRSQSLRTFIRDKQIQNQLYTKKVQYHGIFNVSIKQKQQTHFHKQQTHFHRQQKHSQKQQKLFQRQQKHFHKQQKHFHRQQKQKRFDKQQNYDKRTIQNIQQSLTLRKGSFSKIVTLKKEQLKLLRLRNIISKSIQAKNPLSRDSSTHKFEPFPQIQKFRKNK